MLVEAAPGAATARRVSPEVSEGVAVRHRVLLSAAWPTGGSTSTVLECRPPKHAPASRCRPAKYLERPAPHLEGRGYFGPRGCFRFATAEKLLEELAGELGEDVLIALHYRVRVCIGASVLEIAGYASGRNPASCRCVSTTLERC
jgi:hypothetical protein